MSDRVIVKFEGLGRLDERQLRLLQNVFLDAASRIGPFLERLKREEKSKETLATAMERMKEAAHSALDMMTSGYTESQAIEEVSSKTGYAPLSIEAWVKKLRTRYLEEKIYDLYTAGETKGAIARKLGVHFGTVTARLKAIRARKEIVDHR